MRQGRRSTRAYAVAGGPVTGPAAVPPRCRIPERGEELRLREGDCRYYDDALVLRVERARPELSTYYDGAWLWLDGWRLDANGLPERHVQVLVSCEAIKRHDRGLHTH